MEFLPPKERAKAMKRDMNRRNRHNRFWLTAWLCLAALSVAGARDAFAIPIVNADFSDPDLSNPAVSGINVNVLGNFIEYAPGWVATGFAGEIRLNVGAVGGLAYTGVLPAPQMGFINFNNTLSQVLTGYSLITGTTYTFGADVVSRKDVPTPADAVIELLAGGTPVITLSPGGLAGGTFSNFSASYTATGSSPSGTLEILATGSPQLDFTNVSLTASSPPPLEPMLEPASLALLASGMLGLGLIRRRWI